MFPLTSGRSLTKQGLSHHCSIWFCITGISSVCLQRAWSGLQVIFYHSYWGWMLMEEEKERWESATWWHSPLPVTQSVLGIDCEATVFPAPRFPQKIYPRATIEPGGHEWEHYIPLYLFYLNELVQWCQLWVLRTARVIFVLLLSANMWLKRNLFTAWT